MLSRIHRTGPNTIDVDFVISATLTLTITTPDHHSAVELKRQFDELTAPQQHEFLKEHLRTNAHWVIT